MDVAAFERFDTFRREHFPPERNFIPAHVTLFHALPGEHEATITTTLADACRTRAAFGVAVTGLRSLGRGVAFELSSPELASLRAALATAWRSWLTAQDAQDFRPHITVQNKVAPEVARALHARLATAFTPFTVGAEGLALWRYRGGPWEAVGTYLFNDAPAHP